MITNCWHNSNTAFALNILPNVQQYNCLIISARTWTEVIHPPTALYIDLSKAFDILSFDIILQKLKYDGVMGTELRLLTNYLTN